MVNVYFDKLLWVDTEFSTTVFEESVLLEIAVLVTDADFNELDSCSYVIHQSDEELNKMKNNLLSMTEDKPELAGLKTVYDLQEKSGLLELVRQSTNDLGEVEDQLTQFVEKHFGDTRPILAGNSIGFDKAIIRVHLPKLFKMLYYRVIDVSTLKMLFLNNGRPPYNKKGQHRALEDIRESIEELKYLLDLYKRRDDQK